MPQKVPIYSVYMTIEDNASQISDNVVVLSTMILQSTGAAITVPANDFLLLWATSISEFQLHYNNDSVAHTFFVASGRRYALFTSTYLPTRSVTMRLRIPGGTVSALTAGPFNSVLSITGMNLLCKLGLRLQYYNLLF